MLGAGVLFQRTNNNIDDYRRADIHQGQDVQQHEPS